MRKKDNGERMGREQRKTVLFLFRLCGRSVKNKVGGRETVKEKIVSLLDGFHLLRLCDVLEREQCLLNDNNDEGGEEEA